MKISRLDAGFVATPNAADYDRRERSVTFLRTCLNKPETRATFSKIIVGEPRRMFLKECDENGQLNPERTLIFKVFPNRIVIQDAIDPDFEVSAGVEVEEEGVNISLCIYRTRPEKISNNIWAKYFATEIIRFIESVYYAKAISALWFHNSTNTDIFFEELSNETPESVSKTYHIPAKNRRFLEAAGKTWTGKLAASLGYSRATNFKITYHRKDNFSIEVDFKK